MEDKENESLSCCKQYLIQHLSRQVTQQVTTKATHKYHNSEESVQYACVCETEHDKQSMLGKKA